MDSAARASAPRTQAWWRSSWVRVSIGLPTLATLLLLWTDIFNLGELVLGRLPERPTAPWNQTRLPKSTSPPRPEPQADPRLEARPEPQAEPQPEVQPEVALPESQPAPTCRLAGLPGLESFWKAVGSRRRPQAAGVNRTKRGRRPVGASIAVHPPKFYAASRLLEDWYFCPAAFEALSVHLVFSSEDDLAVFREAQACLSPEVPDGAWEAVVAMKPIGGWSDGGGASNQIIAAYKKWYGAAHMMDLGAAAPEYALLLDSELVLYANHAKAGTMQACHPGGAWSGLLGRLRAREAGKAFPAARVSATHTTYNFGTYTRSGQDYDRLLINENAEFVMRGDCWPPGCAEVKRQVKECLFSWWTDLPWLSVKVGKRMLEAIARHAASDGFRNLSRGVRFPRFEHLAYQQWCALHEGFHFRDVTNITGEAKWGSYLEDPFPGALINELRPLWISSKALDQDEHGKIPPMSRDEPPLLIFHADHLGARFYNRMENEKSLWLELVLALLRLHGRRDFTRDSLNRL